ncbi:hypothetical protein CYMTET_5592 [Cymbomonas tetramitiformis]|uniref:Uncharacterized protein n=1 Tax=Cymbomonas tetramitiformis TaxID=36881 RepID=A0AAE0LIQ1_9CHLO|nr:hypothetical protein CYMTET_5592 [Cymbomonas tetramitiformis]
MSLTLHNLRRGMVVCSRGRGGKGDAEGGSQDRGQAIQARGEHCYHPIAEARAGHDPGSRRRKAQVQSQRDTDDPHLAPAGGHSFMDAPPGLSSAGTSETASRRRQSQQQPEAVAATKGASVSKQAAHTRDDIGGRSTAAQPQKRAGQDIQGREGRAAPRACNEKWIESKKIRLRCPCECEDAPPGVRR